MTARALILLTWGAAAFAGENNPWPLPRDCCDLSPADIATLDKGEAIGRVVKAKDEGDIGLLGAVRVPQSKDAFLAWYRGDGFKQNGMREDAGVFHNPALPTDMERVRFDPSDLRKLQSCKPGTCVAKLTDSEIDAVTKGVHWSAPDAHAKAAGVLRGLMLDYVRAYQRNGNASSGSYLDKGRTIDIWATARSLAANFGGLGERYPDLFARIEGSARPAGGENDFIYWSHENYGFGFKPTLNLSHVMIRREPRALVIASKQLRATHYQDGSLAFTIVADAPGGGSYLVYASRSRFDLLRNGGWKRAIAERRLPALTKKEMEQMRRRLAAVK